MQRKVLLIEDKPITRTGLRVVLNNDPSLSICCEQHYIETLLQAPSCYQPDLLLLDLSCQHGNQISALRQLRSAFPDAPLVVIAGRLCLSHADAALQAGVRGYLLDTDPPERLIQALHRVLNDGIFVSPAVNDRLLASLVGRAEANPANPLVVLSMRELEVYEHTGQGHSTNEIADTMSISPKTVDTYRRRIRQKLHLPSHTALMRSAVSWWSANNTSRPTPNAPTGA